MAVNNPLELWQVTDGGQDMLVAALDTTTILGREPDAGGLQIPNHAISRNHGLISPFRGHWLFRDLGSTNGSWVDGITAMPNRWFVLRPGSMLQLADSAFRVALPALEGTQNSSQPPMWSLIILDRDEFLEEFPIPEYGRALVVGGTGGDLEIRGDLSDSPALIVERLGIDVTVVPGGGTHSTFLNGEPLSRPAKLADLDEVRVGDYVIVVNQPVVRSHSGATQSADAVGGKPTINVGVGIAARSHQSTPTQIAGVRGWDEEGREGTKLGGLATGTERSPVNSRFGQRLPAGGGMEEDEIDETVMLNAKELQTRMEGVRVHRAESGVYRAESSGYSLSSLEDKFIIVVLVLMMLAVLVCVVWFLLAR